MTLRKKLLYFRMTFCKRASEPFIQSPRKQSAKDVRLQDLLTFDLRMYREAEQKTKQKQALWYMKTGLQPALRLPRFGPQYFFPPGDNKSQNYINCNCLNITTWLVVVLGATKMLIKQMNTLLITMIVLQQFVSRKETITQGPFH